MQGPRPRLQPDERGDRSATSTPFTSLSRHDSSLPSFLTQVLRETRWRTAAGRRERACPGSAFSSRNPPPCQIPTHFRRGAWRVASALSRREIYSDEGRDRYRRFRAEACATASPKPPAPAEHPPAARCGCCLPCRGGGS